MINFKWGLISGSIVLVISLVIGIISDVRPSFIFLRAFIFTVIFFGLGIGIHFLISNFFPELLLKDEEPPADEEQPGSRVNITLENTGEYAVPEMYKSQGGSQEIGNIEDLVSGSFKVRSRGEFTSGSEGIDRKTEDDYNSKGNAFNRDGFDSTGSSPAAASGKPVFTPMFGDDSTGLGGLPDLDSMSMAFSSGGDSSSLRLGGGSGSDSDFEPAQIQSFDNMESAPSKSKSKDDDKNQAFKGDFSPQEIAQGIRTVLDKDK